MLKRSLEITVQGVQIPITGGGLLERTSHLVSAELIWPRVGVPRKSTAQPCVLQEGQADFDSIPWGRRILFRETVEGRFALAVTLTEVLDDEAIEKILRLFSGSLLAFGADALALAVPGVGRMLGAPIDALAKDIAAYPGPTLLVEGLVELDAADFPDTGERLLTVQLRAAQTLSQVGQRRTAGRARTQRKLLLEKGAPNGEITLRIRTI